MPEGIQNPIIGMFELDNKHLVIILNEPILLIWSWNSSTKSKSNSNTYSVGESSLTWAVKHDEKNILCGWEDGKIYKLIPEKSDKPVLIFDHHTDVVFGIEKINSSKFVSNSTDLKLILWDVNTGERLKVISHASDMIMHMWYDADLDLLIFSSLDGKVRAVELESDSDNVKYEIDQGSPIFFCAVIGYQEMKYFVKKEEIPIRDQVIQEESKDEITPRLDTERVDPDSASQHIPSNKKIPQNDDVNNSKTKIKMNEGISKTMYMTKKKVKINGLFDINKHVLDDVDAEEMLKQGKCYVIATINQEKDNSLIFWDMISLESEE